jgi:adenylate cyclase class 2
MSADQVEIEVKFLVEDRARLCARLLKIGAASEGEVFEINYRYDDAGGRLLAAQSLLRLRQDRRARLTFKQPRPDHPLEFKVYDEYEVIVSDFGRMHQILRAIGLRRDQIYEKRREVFHWQKAQICVDRLPFGDFAEIEGEPEDIRAAARELGLPWERRILANYLRMFEVLRQELDLDFHDLTFKNMKAAPDGALRLIRRFEACAGLSE